MKGSQSDVRFLLALLAVSLALNTFLGLRLMRPQGSPPEPGLAAGDSVPPLELRALDGQVQTLSYGSPRPTVVYVFAPSCRFCGQNFGNIHHLAKSRNTAFNFVGVSLDDKDLASYLKTHELGFPAFAVTPETQKAYRLGPVPQTIVVDASGKVLRSWMGAYSGDAAREIEQYFAVDLPGLSEVVDASSPHTKES